MSRVTSSRCPAKDASRAEPISPEAPLIKTRPIREFYPSRLKPLDGYAVGTSRLVPFPFRVISVQQRVMQGFL